MNQSYWVEIQGWDWNALTISFVATVFFTGFESFGVYKQARKIQRDKSVEAISGVFFLYNVVFFSVMTVYGVYERSLALTIHAAAIIMHLPILWQLWKYRWRVEGISFKETSVILFGVFGLVNMVLMVERQILFMEFYVVRFVSIGDQPYEIWKKGRGVVDIKMLCIFAISAVFWIVYAFAVEDWVLQIAATTIFLIMMTSIVIWFKKK